jgi:hypothetical protein
VIKRDWTLLFNEYDLGDVLRSQYESIRERVLAIDKGAFLHASDEYLAASVASRLVVAPLTIDEDEVEVSVEDAKIDVSHDFNRSSWGDGPTYVDGLEVTYHLPFGGDHKLWECQPSPHTFNPPRAQVGSRELTFPIDQPDREVAATKASFLSEVATIKQWLGWVNSQVAEYNNKLEAEVRRHVTARRQELDKTKSDLDALGFKVKTATASKPLFIPAPEAAKTRASRRKALSRSYDVALSFAGEDRTYVDAVANALKGLDVEVFYDQFEQVELWGADLAEHLGNVYGKQSRFVVLFASKHYAKKAWPNHEKRFALGAQLKDGKGRILPVRFDDTEIPGLPPTTGYLDLRVLSPEKLAELIRQKIDTGDGGGV